MSHVQSAGFPPMLPADDFFSPTRKRQAPGPILPETDSVADTANEPLESPALKRRRPNLANGFSTLSIGPNQHPGRSPLPTYQEYEIPAFDPEVDEDDRAQDFNPQDVRVEMLPDTPRSRRRPGTRPVYGSSSASEASVSSSDSDSTYTVPPGPSRYGGIPQMPDSVEEPETMASDNFVIEEVAEVKPRKRRHEDDEGLRKRRRNDDMDVDMDGGSADREQDMEEIGGDFDRGRRKQRGWYEPEKDRIVVTSLPSSRDSSVDSQGSDGAIHLAQPGLQGFTISPSLLTRLLAEHRKRIDPNLPPEKALVRYRPLLPPGANWDDIVRLWQGGLLTTDTSLSDSGRFEELADDEPIAGAPALSPTDTDMDMSMDIE